MQIDAAVLETKLFEIHCDCVNPLGLRKSSQNVRRPYIRIDCENVFTTGFKTCVWTTLPLEVVDRRNFSVQSSSIESMEIKLFFTCQVRWLILVSLESLYPVIPTFLRSFNDVILLFPSAYTLLLQVD